MLHQQCHLCSESFEVASEEALSYRVIEHFRLMHPELHEVIKQMADLHLAWQFQHLKPEDFA